MAKRDLALKPRLERTKDPCKDLLPTHFSLQEIKQHFDETLLSIKKEYAIAGSLYAEGKRKDAQLIWRSQVVFLEGLLDFYLHEISKYALHAMFCGKWEKSEKYKNFMVPMEAVEKGVKDLVSDEWFFIYLNDVLSRKVFLAAEEMKKQLNLIGIDFGTAMHAAFKKRTVNESHKFGTKVAEELYKRRNCIAHQNDREHANAKQKTMSKKYVEEACSKIEKVVEAIHQIAIDKEKSV